MTAPELPESTKAFNAQILAERAAREWQLTGLPHLVPGMSHRAAQVEIRRARRRAEVRESIARADAEERAQQQPPIDPAEGAARALLAALDSGGEQQQRAERFLQTAHPKIKEKILELAGAGSAFKTRRSNKPNGY